MGGKKSFVPHSREALIFEGAETVPERSKGGLAGRLFQCFLTYSFDLSWIEILIDSRVLT